MDDGESRPRRLRRIGRWSRIPTRISLAPPRRLRLLKRRSKARPPRPWPEPVDLVEHHARSAALRERLLQNIAPAATGAIFALVILRVLIIAEGNPSTALGLLERAGPLQVVGGVLVQNIGFIGTGLTNAVGVFAGGNSGLNRYERRRLWYYFAFLTLWLSFVVSWITTATLLLLSAFYGYGAWRRRHPKRPPNPTTFDPDEWLKRAPDDVMLREHWTKYREAYQELKRDGQLKPDRKAELEQAISVAATAYNTRTEEIRTRTRPVLEGVAISLILVSMGPVIQNAFSDRPWLPAETVVLNNGERFSAYVVADTGHWMTALREHGRLLETVRADAVVSRQVCAVPGGQASQQRTIWRLFARKLTSYKPCPRDVAGAANDQSRNVPRTAR